MNIVRGIPDLEVAIQIAAEGFQQQISSELREDVGSHLKKGELIYRLVEDEKDIGFAIFNVINTDILYLSGVIINSYYQKHGLVASLVHQVRIEVPRVTFLALRTQSLRMWVAGERLCKEWYPNKHSQIPNDIIHVGNSVGAYLKCSFPYCKGIYGSALYGVKPIYTNNFLQNWWDSICTFEQGDAVLCAGRLK